MKSFQVVGEIGLGKCLAASLLALMPPSCMHPKESMTPCESLGPEVVAENGIGQVLKKPGRSGEASTQSFAEAHRRRIGIVAPFANLMRRNGR